MKKAAIAAMFAVFWVAPTLAQATGKGYARLPARKGTRSTLLIKITGYRNGKVEAVVRNTSARAQNFDPQGLYFVPDGNPDKAPQRMGAAGPFEVLDSGTWKPRRKMRVRPGARAKVRLRVFCLDSHRASPRNGQGFSVAVKRLPKHLQKRIVAGTRRIFSAKGAYRRSGAKSAAQSHIWRVRNSKWIRLQGERKNEKSAKRYRGRFLPQRIRRNRIHRNPFIQRQAPQSSR